MMSAKDSKAHARSTDQIERSETGFLPKAYYCLFAIADHTVTLSTSDKARFETLVRVIVSSALPLELPLLELTQPE